MKPSSFLFTLFLALFALAGAQASEPGTIAQALKRSISLDDDMTDWDGLPVYAVNLSNSESPEAVSQQGYFNVAWDDTYLYIRGVFEQPQSSLTVGLTEDAEEWWNADTLEVFVQLTPESTLHYAANPDGTGFTNFLTDNYFETYSSVTEDFWTLQLAFPLGVNALPLIQTEDVWEFKVGRGNTSTKEYSLWPLGGDFLGEENYGLIYFTEQIESESIISEKLRDR